ncbi:hypothetical protein MPH_02775 [Macrophomina phaseolina MS6]|uniref:Uncharacterized protein n=1 Tax=Macrophomina phaseolina (strain MS6) TaxID=1126212 RepID=K2S4L7_MACPH|nr:hypothetical protein MPH_02775 [Macrophomina phaseolina MS6]
MGRKQYFYRYVHRKALIPSHGRPSLPRTCPGSSLLRANPDINAGFVGVVPSFTNLSLGGPEGPSQLKWLTGVWPASGSTIATCILVKLVHAPSIEAPPFISYVTNSKRRSSRAVGDPSSVSRLQKDDKEYEIYF